jgi:hypothetical protein
MLQDALQRFSRLIWYRMGRSLQVRMTGLWPLGVVSASHTPHGRKLEVCLYLACLLALREDMSLNHQTL